MPDETPGGGGLWRDEPSPEQTFSGALPSRRVNVVLTDANGETPALVLKAIRATLSALRGGAEVALSEAEAFWHRFDAGDRPVLLGYAETKLLAEAAADAGLEASKGNVRIGYALTPGEIRAIAREHAGDEPADEPTPPPSGERMDPHTLLPLVSDQPADDWTPSLEAARTALVLMATCDGNAQAVIATARMLRHATRSEVYEDVVRLCLAAFPVTGP